GYAPWVLLSGGEKLQGIAIPDLQRDQALRHGVPESVLLFEKTSTSTAEQARFLRPILEQRGFRRAIVVTSNFHTRRTRYLFRRVFRGSPVDTRVYPVQNDFFSPDRWWSRDSDTEQVVLEYIKLGLAFLRYR
ncbi:MAG: YdcF family protein, partial [bacterium]